MKSIRAFVPFVPRVSYRRAARAFAADDGGSVTIQIIIFSLLLFGMAGVVLDSGRVYATHSQMQAFADQMALVAANELDGRDDAIQRATNAVYGFDGSLPFMYKAGLEVGAFQVQGIQFFATMAPSDRLQNDMTEAFPPGTELAVAHGTSPTYAGGDAAAASAAAAFAVVSVVPKEIFSVFAHIANSLVDNTAPDEASRRMNLDRTLDFGAVAAASMERSMCADISTLVLCNPWEGISPSPLDAPKGDPAHSVKGRSLMYFAPNYAGAAAAPVNDGTTHGSLYPWDVNNQLFRLTNPVGDPAGICSSEYLVGMAGEDLSDEGSAAYMQARDRCLMARARNETVCWGPKTEFRIAPADGDMVSRSLNTAFDNWMSPFREAISDPVEVGSTGLTRAQFYEPDQLATTTFETADRHGPIPSTNPKQDGVPDYNVAPNSDAFSYYYDTVPMPGMTMLYRVHGLGIGYDTCHANTYRKYAVNQPAGACSNDFIGDYYEGGTTGASTTMSRLRSYWQYMYYQSPSTLPSSVNTWYEMYQLERERIATLNTFDANSRVVQWSDENTAMYGLASNATKYVKQGPDEYMHRSSSPGLLNPGYERRRVRSAFVNCGAAVAGGMDAAGTYEVGTDDIRVMDVYLPSPPGHFCGYNQLGCELEDSIETRLYVELIEDMTEEMSEQRFIAQLVR